VAAARKTATFNVTAVHAMPQGQVTITSKVWITPTQARAEVKHPLDGDQTFLVTGGFLYILDTKSKRGLKDPLPPDMRKSQDNFDLLVAKFAFDASGPLQMSQKVRTEQVSGYNCDVYSNSVTQGEMTRTITVWMPQAMEPKFPLKAVLNEKLSRPGASFDKTTTITLSEVKVGVAIPASQFAVPTGYQLVSSQQPAPKPQAAPRRGSGGSGGRKPSTRPSPSR
jgi:outer membrane lipoprotein-sorting protein